MNKKNILLISLMLGFFFVGYVALQDAKPQEKDARIYTELKPYIPYVLEKRVGGYSIVSKITGEKEKPPATLLFKRLDQLEQLWGKEFLKLEENKLIVINDKKEKIAEITINLPQEREWIKSFFGI